MEEYLFPQLIQTAIRYPEVMTKFCAILFIMLHFTHTSNTVNKITTDEDEEYLHVEFLAMGNSGKNNQKNPSGIKMLSYAGKHPVQAAERSAPTAQTLKKCSTLHSGD